MFRPLDSTISHQSCLEAFQFKLKQNFQFEDELIVEVRGLLDVLISSVKILKLPYVPFIMTGIIRPYHLKQAVF